MKAVPVPVRRAMSRLVQVVRERLDERAWLRISTESWPASAPPARYVYMPGWRRLVLLVAGILVAVALIGSLLIAWPVIVLPVVLFVVFGVQSLGIQGAWADRLLSPALARAAADLGTPTLTNQWRITGAKAAQLGNELRHLTRLPPPAWPDGRAPTAAEVERYYIAAAGPIMRRYLQPVLTAEEHRDEPLRMVDQRDQYAPGAPWPVLHPEEHQWHQPRTHPPTT